MPSVSEKTIEACARAAHEANRAYCLAIGDSSQLPWDDASEWQRASARMGAVSAAFGATPEQSHAGWLAQKERDGWTYGPVKDQEKKTHPCMVPYDQLSQEQKMKDHVFVAVVTAMGGIDKEGA